MEDGTEEELVGGRLPHLFYGRCLSVFSKFKERKLDASLIAGAYARTADVASSSLTCDTSSRCTTLQTPSIFIDLRIQPSRDAVAKKCGRNFEGLTCEELVQLGSEQQHCFAGISIVEQNVEGFEGSPVATRYHAIDMQPAPRVNPNQWRIQTLFELGGWVEWSVRNDRFGQAAYIEHWQRLEDGAGPFLCLARDDESRKGFLAVAGNYFCYILDRPTACQLPVVVPGQGGHPKDRGKIGPLLSAAAAQVGAARTGTGAEAAAGATTSPPPSQEEGEAGARQRLIALLSLECSFGRVRSRGAGGPTNWLIERSTLPWLEGEPLAMAMKCGLSMKLAGDTGLGTATIERMFCFESDAEGRNCVWGPSLGDKQAEWDVVENSFNWDELATLWDTDPKYAKPRKAE